MSNTKNRLRDFISLKGLTIRAFEESIGAANGYVNSISRGIGKDKLDKIIEKYPDLDVLWLLTGERSKNRRENTENIPSIEKKGVHFNLKEAADFVAKNFEDSKKVSQLFEITVRNDNNEYVIERLSKSNIKVEKLES